MLRLPKSFKPLFWSYKFSSVDTKKDKKRIVINTINYGKWEHWQWLIKNYGKREVKEIIEKTPKTEFRPQALKLICILLNIKKLKYASRSDYIRAKRHL